MAKQTKAVVKREHVSQAIAEKTIADSVFKKISELEDQGGLDLPVNYSPANALKSAWLIFQDDTNLMKTSDISKANALLDMVIQGLSPSKKQCYFIAYGNEAKMQRSYLGNVAVTKRLEIVDDIYAQVIYEGDEVEYEIKDGVTEITKHIQKFENINPQKVKGAYAIVYTKTGSVATIMTMDQIKDAWSQGAMKGNSPAHKKFTDEMAKKTVINRAVKHFQATSDDSDLLAESVNRTHDVDSIEEAEAEVIQNQIDTQANTQEIDVELEFPEEDQLPEDLAEDYNNEEQGGDAEEGSIFDQHDGKPGF